MDSDRGYAWPCWDVDYKSMFPWNGCDPFPLDTLVRAAASGLGSLSNWGSPGPAQRVKDFNYQGVDLFGNPRSGTAFVNATALSTPGDCGYGDLPFPFFVIKPSDSPYPEACGLDPTTMLNPKSPGGRLPFDYQLATYQQATSRFVEGAPSFIVTDPTAGAEPEGRLIQFLRAQAQLKEPLQILANAATLQVNGTASLAPCPIPVDTFLVTAVAQLAVTGREAFTAFNNIVPQEARVISAVAQFNPGASFDPTALASAAKNVLDSGLHGPVGDTRERPWMASLPLLAELDCSFWDRRYAPSTRERPQRSVSPV